MNGFVLWLDHLGGPDGVAAAGAADLPARIGPKLARLAELRAIGLTVPSGFAVTAAAHRLFLAGGGLHDTVDAAFARLGGAPEMAVIEESSRALRAAAESTPLPEVVRSGVTAAYEELGVQCMRMNPPVAVRSSAVGEDSAESSFAGAFDTYLGIRGVDRVLTAIRRCWGSAFSPRAISHLLRHGPGHCDMPMAVGVVELVAARSSGVAFSAHPVTGRRDRIVVEASWGFGEATVQGHVTPDHVEVDKDDGRVLRYDVTTKQVLSAFDPEAAEVREMPMPRQLRDRRVLDAEEIERIAEAVIRIEDHYGAPVDVEWVIDRNRRSGEPITVVQARPITTPTVEPGVWDPAEYAARYAFGDTVATALAGGPAGSPDDSNGSVFRDTNGSAFGDIGR